MKLLRLIRGLATHLLSTSLISTSLAAFVFAAAHSPVAPEEPLEWIQVSKSHKEFVFAESKKTFVPWGFNYDHDSDGRLLEEYWQNEWGTVVSDFDEMKELGANVVRIHLQVGAFMESPTQVRASSLSQLERVVHLAEQKRLYLDITGLGCYHKIDVPAWYDKLSETERWQVQTVFWEAIANTCADSPAIFCYDLMNEPVVPGGDDKREDWLGPSFGGKHFTQFISLDRDSRPRHEIARNWIRTLSAAIRKHDERHLITVGLVDWSLDRPGLTSGFIPAEIAPDLDFLAVHLYPKAGNTDEALETLKGFAACDKPLIIEETFPLKCDERELGLFIEESRVYTAGWIGFYWGTTPDEYRKLPQSIANSMTLGWLELFQERRPAATP